MPDSTTSTTPSDRSRRDELTEEVQRSRANLERLEDEFQRAMGDSGVIQEDRDAIRRSVESARTTLKTAQTTLDRFDDGSYGTCAECGGEIAPERLEAIPDATTCRDCSSGRAST